MNQALSRAEDQPELQVGDVCKPSIALPDVGRLKLHVLVDRQRHGEAASFLVPPFSRIVKGFITSEGFPDAAIDREGIPDPNPLAIAVDFICRKKPSDVHVSVGDLEFANGEPHCPVNSKLVLLESLRNTSRESRGFIQIAWWRNLVVQIAGSNRENLCGPNRHVNHCDWYFHFAEIRRGDVIKAVEV